MLKKTALIITLLFFSLQCGKSAPSHIPLGEWKYNLFMNGVALGKAFVSNELKNGKYTSVMDMTLVMGDTKNTARQVVVETDTFQPISLEITNTIENNGRVEKIHTTAVFEGKKITVKKNDIETKITIDKPFVLDGTYFTAQLIRENYKTGARVESFLYDPTFELEEPIRVIAQVMGREEISIGSSKIPVIHVVQAIEGVKNIDSYIDESGITRKVVIIMLNNKFELIKED